MSRTLQLHALPGIPLVQPGDDVYQLIVDALQRSGQQLVDGDLLVVAQKIISKSEGCYVDLAEVTAGPEALDLADVVEKDPRLVQLILDESREVVRHRPG